MTGSGWTKHRGSGCWPSREGAFGGLRGRAPKGCSRSCRSIFAPWRGSAWKPGCASPTSPGYSGRRWICAGDVRGFILTRPRGERRLRCRSPLQPCWCYASRLESIRFYVFSYRGNPIKQLNTKAWRKALERAGIEDFRRHDLRHYSESRIIPSGANKQRWVRVPRFVALGIIRRCFGTPSAEN